MPKIVTQDEIIVRFRNTHGDEYDYSKVEYKGMRVKVCIVCSLHGKFWQCPIEHINGCGCPECAGNKQKSNEQFIAEAKSIWGDKIDFAKTIYVNTHTKSLFTCPIHGDFEQYPAQLLQGHGCQKCGWDRSKTLIFGVGFNDLNIGSCNPLYITWRGMIQRGYDPIVKSKYPTYQDVTVCTEWHTLSNFKKWFDENYVIGYHLDKDILVNGNKIYSPETCCFVPKEINIAFKTQKRNKYGLPIGVTRKGDKFVATANFGNSRLWIGGFPTPEAAFLAYKKEKEQYVKVLAEKYYKEGKITERVYLALLAYRVEITD